MRGIVLFAHGARDPEWARPFEAIRERVRAQRPGDRIELAFLEMMPPTLEQAIDALVAAGVPSVRVFPLFMAQGGHLKHDLPRILEAVRARHPRVPVALESAIGDEPVILEAIAGWIVARAG